MKENRLGPRKWAFVVVAGGAVLALPFMQRQPETKPEPPAVDVTATLLPEVNATAPAVTASMTGHIGGQPVPGQATNAQATNGLSANATESLGDSVVPTWPALPHSPFDELVQQKAIVVDAKPTEEIVPMQPLRPWISAPNLSTSGSASTALANAPSAAPRSATDKLVNMQGSTAAASPWRDDDASDDDNGLSDVDANHQVLQSYGHGRRQLPVNAGPADQYTYEEIAQKLNLPPEPKHELASAIVPADQVLPIPPLNATQPVSLAAQSQPANTNWSQSGLPRSTAVVPKSSVVLSRQPVARPLGAQVRFGQTDAQPTSSNTQFQDSPPAMVPLPGLPEERRGHIIMQPQR